MVSGSKKDASFLDEFKPARLMARDPEDLAVISALLQDAVTVTQDVVWLPSSRRFALMANRYRWEAPEEEERVRCGAHVDGVAHARCKGLDLTVKDRPIVILALSFEPDDEPPGGVLRIACAPDSQTGGTVEIELQVEALEIGLKDVTRPWPAKGRPAHEVGGEEL